MAGDGRVGDGSATLEDIVVRAAEGTGLIGDAGAVYDARRIVTVMGSLVVDGDGACLAIIRRELLRRGPEDGLVDL